MSEFIEGVADAAVDALKNANRSGKKDRGADRGIVGALSNGAGLVAVRMCLFLMCLVVSMTCYIVQDKIGSIKEDIHNVDAKVGKVDLKVDGVNTTLSGFMKDVAGQEMNDRLDIVQLKDRARSFEQLVVKRP